MVSTGSTTEWGKAMIIRTDNKQLYPVVEPVETTASVHIIPVVSTGSTTEWGKAMIIRTNNKITVHGGFDRLNHRVGQSDDNTY